MLSPENLALSSRASRPDRKFDSAWGGGAAPGLGVYSLFRSSILRQQSTAGIVVNNPILEEIIKCRLDLPAEDVEGLGMGHTHFQALIAAHLFM
jgi:hypothetical protein